MNDDKGYIELVKRARAGDSKSMETLAGLVRGRLYAYVYRMVLEEDLAQDIVQETMLEMFKVLGKLNRADRFWPWLRAIAFSKLRRHHSRHKGRRTVSISSAPELAGAAKDCDAGLANLVADELRQAVIGTMRELRPQYRRVLTMRCYEEMAYSDIAELMGCSELSARVTFCRAKKTLQKRLSSKGFGRGFLLTALVIFGKMTAPSEAAAAGVSVTAATTKVGVAAGLAAAASSKTGIVSLTAAAVLAAGTIVATSWPQKPTGPWESGEGVYVSEPMTAADKGAEECWYYYPLNVNGPVMMRVVRWDSNGRGTYSQWWQDDGGNYHFDKRKNTISINNYRISDAGLSVLRLPTDGVNLRDFISMVEGRRDLTEYVSADGPGLLVITQRGGEEASNGSRIVRHYSLLDEEYFRYKWPADARVADNRDRMHRRGWTYFKISGRIGGEAVSGGGRIPFVYVESARNYAWLRMKIGQRLRLEDSGAGACVYDGGGGVVARYEGGSLFKGLGRPWMGLHTIDTVRRDAAEERLWFETRMGEQRHAEVVVNCGEIKLVYEIDLELDVVDKITFLGSEGNDIKGQVIFSYLQELDGADADNELVAPRRSSSRSYERDRLGMLWLVELLNLGR
jgi:RNA polymerase sigma-70 factor (ECF subfamily)